MEKAARESNHDTGTIPYTPVGIVLHNHLDTNSIVGTVGLPHGRKLLTCLWASIVL